MKRKFKVVFTILLVLTAIIPVLADKRIIDHQRHVQELGEEYAKWGIEIGPLPWYIGGMGSVVVFLVVVTIDAWIVSSIIWFQERRQKDRKEVKSKSEKFFTEKVDCSYTSRCYRNLSCSFASRHSKK